MKKSQFNPPSWATILKAEMEIIEKEKNLQELVNTEPKKVKR